MPQVRPDRPELRRGEADGAGRATRQRGVSAGSGRREVGAGPVRKLHVRVGKGARGSGPRERMVPLINGADATLRWFIQDVWGHFDADHTRPGAPLFPSERRNSDGSCRPPAHLGRRADPARDAPLLRLAALPVRAGTDLHPKAARARLDRFNAQLHPRPPDSDRGRLDRGPTACRRPLGRAEAPQKARHCSTGCSAMNLTGGPDLLVAARRALLDALDARATTRNGSAPATLPNQPLQQKRSPDAHRCQR